MSVEDTEHVAAFIHEATWSAFPRSVQRAAKRSMLDLLATLAAGTSTEASEIAREVARSLFGEGEAALAFDGRRLPPVGAAFANATTLDSMDAHDGHRLAKGHAGAGVLAATLGMAQEEGASGEDLLATMVVGYEIALRASMALHATAQTYHASGAWVALGAAAATARSRGMDANATYHALGIAEYHGPRSPMMRCIDHPSMVKDGTGWGSMVGVFAGELAAQGFTGAPATLIEGPADRGLWASLGEHWRILETYYKLYPCCRWAQPALQAALALQAENGFQPGQIAEIQVETFEAAAHLGHPRPDTTEAAQYSLPYPLAVALLTGGLDPADVLPPALERPEALELADRVRLVVDDEIEAAFPADALARVIITLKDGQRFVSDTCSAPGDPSAPLPERALTNKYKRYTRPLLGRERSETLQDLVSSLPEIGDLGPFFALITAPLDAGWALGRNGGS